MSTPISQSGGGRIDPPNHALLQQIISTLTHDLRTPLGTITNYTSFLQESPSEITEQVRDVLGLIRSNTDRAARMVQCVDDALELVRRLDDGADREKTVDWSGFLKEVLSLSPRMSLSSTVVAPCLSSDGGLFSFVCRAYLGVVLSASEDVDVALDFAMEKGEDGLRLRMTCRPGSLQSGASRAADSPTSQREFLSHDRGSDRQITAMSLGFANAIFESRGGVLQFCGNPQSLSVLDLDMPDRQMSPSGEPGSPNL